MIDKAQKLIEKYEELEHQLGRPEIVSNQEQYSKIHKAYKDITPAQLAAKEYIALRADHAEWKAILEAGDDADMVAAAKEELASLNPRIEELEKRLQILMVPKSPYDQRNAVIEIRGGTGGDESALFAGDLFRMYRVYCEKVGLRIQVTSASEGTAGGFKEIVLEVQGPGAYGTLKFESGVHRVQRVPATETQGRVHTSAATVAVMPEAEEVDIEIREVDLKIDTFRAGGAGGQHINKTDSAVRITHLPTGLVVACQDERSQHKNRAKAMDQLRAKLLDKVLSEKEQKESATRKSLVGTGDRSAKIRTYNFPQNRLTDHRIDLTLYSLESIVAGDLQPLVDALQMADAQEKLASMDIGS
jgi:peptide chain release factor 1